jgi:hypothetical protein
MGITLSAAIFAFPFGSLPRVGSFVDILYISISAKIVLTSH